MDVLFNATEPLFLLGATGVGKSAAGVEVARRWGNVAILAMDAMQVYRGADVGTSKPSAAERAEIIHGGLDLAEFGESFDVARYVGHAAAFLREQREASRRVIVVGGTGLYFRALTRGLCEAPQGSDELRAELAALPVAELRARLKRVDPAMLGKIDAANPRRLARAIEVMEASGRSLRAWQAETPEPVVKAFRAVWIQRSKAELLARLERRVAAMFAQGWGEEVRGLVARFGIEKVKAFAGIGYREIAEGATELPGQVRSQTEFGNEGAEGTHKSHVSHPSRGAGNALQRDIFVATRRYAKRQLTWFAREPTLQPVMLTGDQLFSEAARGVAHGSWPDLL